MEDQENINICMLDLPTTIRSYVILNRDDTYTVVINARLNRETQLKAYAHELLHIQRGDHRRSCSVDLIELHVHGTDPM